MVDQNGPKWRNKWIQMAIPVENNHNKIIITNLIIFFSHFMGLLVSRYSDKLGKDESLLINLCF